MRRFVNNCRTCNIVYTSLSLEVEERKQSEFCIFRLSQINYFSNEYNCLLNDVIIKKRSPLLALQPFLDCNKVIRVGGRLRNSNLAYDKKHPIILSVKCNVVFLIVNYIHEKYFHCNKSVILTYLYEKFWIVGNLTNLIKKVIRNCILCTRLKAVLGKQIMGQLPSTRTEVSRPFHTTGVDLIG